MKIKAFAVVFLILGVSGLISPLVSQTTNNVDSQIEALRADLRADKVSIVTEALQLNDKEAASFWPVYRKYDLELTNLNDNLVELVKTYADKFGTITDSDADAMINKSLDIQAQRIALKRKYVPLFTKATSSLTAAKFFQLEYRLELLLNLKLASELPSLLAQPSTSSGAAKKNR